MRRTSTCAWRLRPRAWWPWVASRRLSCITTRWTAARSCAGPDGSARSSSFSGRDGGSACVRSICARSSSRRRCASKRRIWSRVSGGNSDGAPSPLTSPPASDFRPSARRIRWTSTPSTPEPSPRRPNAAIASRARSRERGVVAVADRLEDLLAQRVVVDPLAAGDPVALGRVALAHSRLERGALGGAEEVAVEHEVEHAPVLGRLRQRRRQRLAERAGARPLDLAERGERVVELRRAERHALGAQRVGKPDQVPIKRQAARPRVRRPCRDRCGA